MDAMVCVEGLSRVFGRAEAPVHALSDVSQAFERGRMTAVVGRSGAGKTTLLNLIAGLDRPTEGRVWIDGSDVTALGEDEKATLRRDKLSFVFQSFGLLPLLTAAENVSIPLRMQHVARTERERRVTEALEWVGLRPRADHRPHELSGGEQQRVALARALAARPALMLADEPTGQLDSLTGKKVLAVMRQLVDELGITLIVVTHDVQVRDTADVVIHLRDGRIVDG
ncbi:MAG: ABC transporter ATP-binding protein [Chloroflexi bacterium]|nr:ABC transporter ATP-binding protein [Chloroflexota bacterium]